MHLVFWSSMFFSVGVVMRKANVLCTLVLWLCHCGTVVSVVITSSLHCLASLLYHLNKQADVVVGLAAKG